MTAPGEIGTAQAELAQEFAKGEFPLPLVPKDESSKLLVCFGWDNFDSLKENKDGSIHTCHGVAYTEESNETVKRNSDINMPLTKRRSVLTEKVHLPEKKFVPHKTPPLFNKENQVTYNNTYASSLTSIWRLQLHIYDHSVSHRDVGWVSFNTRYTRNNHRNSPSYTQSHTPI